MKLFVPRTTALVSFLLLTVCTITSCSKDTPTPVKVKTSADLLVQSPWKWTTRQYVNKDGSKTTHTLSDVQKNAIYTYVSDGTFTVTGNADGSTTHGTWKITDTTLTISLKDDDGTTVSQNYALIVTDTALTMSISQTFTAIADDGTPTTYYGQIDTYKH